MSEDLESDLVGYDLVENELSDLDPSWEGWDLIEGIGSV
jgi:hypothetical protein